MANMNILFRKGYLLAGVMMAANMFVVNEVRAMDQLENDVNSETEEERKKIEEDKNNKKIFSPIKIQLEIFYFGRIILTFLAH